MINIGNVEKILGNTVSHSFCLGVIICYSNLIKYKYTITKDYILIKQKRQDVVFLLNSCFDYNILKRNKPLNIICEKDFIKLSMKTSEIVYDVEDIFKNNLTKQIRRGISINKRIDIRDIKTEKENLDVNYLFRKWKKFKENDKNTFQITFSPIRYIRAHYLSKLGLNIYKKIIYIKGSPYGAIVFYIKGKVAYELSFFSVFFEKKLKIINDLNECIIINIFYDLYKNYDIKYINVGSARPSKGLRTFKHKIKYKNSIIYSYKLN